MNKLLLLIKINLSTFFNIDKVKNATNKKEIKQGISKVLITLVAFVYLAYYFYFIANQSIKSYIALNCPYILLVQFFVMTSIMILFTNIIKIKGTLFDFKDYNILMSLPLKKSTIILSKLSLIYISSLITTLFLMIPGYIVYINNISVTPLFHVLFILTLFIIPLVPIIISTIIGSILSYISSKFKMKNLATTLISLIFVIAIMYGSFKMESMTSLDIANIGKSMVNLFNKVYPLTNIYLDIINNTSIISLIEFVLIPLFLFIIYLVIINKFYDRINTNFSTSYKNKNFKLKTTKQNSPLKALYFKELKRYFSSSNYILNTSIGMIMLTLLLICLIIFGSKKIDTLIEIQDFSKMIVKLGPIMLGSFCLINCSTSSSLSLEGKNLWILKSLPVSPMTIMLSKILVNLTILIPAIIIDATILNIYLHTNFITFIFMYLTPIAYSLFVSILGMILNLQYPNFVWTNEIRVIKQSFPTFLSLIIGMALAIVPFTIKTNLSDTTFVILVTLAFYLLNIILYLYLYKLTNKKFKTL